MGGRNEQPERSARGFERVRNGRPLRCLALLLLAALAFACDANPPRRVAVLFLLDTLRQDALGCYGNPNDPTPRIDALAQGGVRFAHAMSSSGWTLPAVGSLLTGTWPTIHGAMGKGVMLTPIRDELATAAEVFREHGHRTVAIANAAFVSPMVGVQRGFDVFDHRYSYNEDARPAGEVIDLAIQQLDQLEEHAAPDAFFLIHLFDPHLDYAPPAGFEAKFTQGRATPPLPITSATVLQLQTGPRKNGPPRPADQAYVRGAYLGEVNYMDAEVGRFVDALRERGLYDEATIVVTSDHGEEFWEHGGFEHGHSLYDELLRVPLIIKPPARREAKERSVDAAVRMVDVMPTLFEAHAIPRPESFEGRSLWPLMRGEPDEPRPALAESTLYGPERIAWRSGRYKYIHDARIGPNALGELYDWRADPGETTNLTPQQPERARALRDELFEFHFRLRERAAGMASNPPVDLSPVRIQQLRSLGYIR